MFRSCKSSSGINIHEFKNTSKNACKYLKICQISQIVQDYILYVSLKCKYFIYCSYMLFDYMSFLLFLRVVKTLIVFEYLVAWCNFGQSFKCSQKSIFREFTLTKTIKFVVVDDKCQIRLLSSNSVICCLIPVSAVKVLCFFSMMVCIFSLIREGFLHSPNKVYRFISH